MHRLCTSTSTTFLASFCWAAASSVALSRRAVAVPFSSSGNTTMRDAADRAEAKMAAADRQGGRMYLQQQKLWPSLEALERDLTEMMYAPEEHLPPDQLPKPSAKTTTAQLESPPESLLLESVGSSAELVAATAASIEPVPEPVTSTEPSPCTWAELGLDVLLSKLAEEKLGARPTRAQARLLPELINEDHNDVIMCGSTGCGKTTALLLAALSGIRAETAGMNIMVAESSINARRMFDFVVSFCGEYGGTIVDRPNDDMSWVLLADNPQSYKYYHETLFQGVRVNPNGPARLFITTAETMCQLLFQKHIEFERFGFLRRVYVDDCSEQVALLRNPTPEEISDREGNPTPVELLLATLHQLPGPAIRSILQIACVSTEVDTGLKKHLLSLCIKPQAKKQILAPVRIPSTLTCMFSFYLANNVTSPLKYLFQLIRNANETIPGRAVIFLHRDVELISARAAFRQLGMDAKVLSEVLDPTNNKKFVESPSWRFLLLHEGDATDVDIPFVSHVFIAFAPANRYSYLHMAARAARVEQMGWVYVVCDRRSAKDVREVVSELDINVENNIVDEHLNSVPPESAVGWLKDLPLWGMDPQYVVQQAYELADSRMTSRHEIFRKPVWRCFKPVDHTPSEVLWRGYKNALRLQKDVIRSPDIALDMVQRGLLDSNFRPTETLREMLREPDE